MTVRELKEKLERFDDNMPVVVYEQSPLRLRDLSVTTEIEMLPNGELPANHYWSVIPGTPTAKDAVLLGF